MNEMNIPEIDLPRIIVIGSGFAGLKLCRKINSSYYQVVLFDKNNYHTFQPLMYQVATSGLEPDSIAYPIRKVFKHKKHFHFRWATVLNVNTETQEVETSIGSLRYDYLVIATGADSNYFGLLDVAENSLPMKSLVESLNLRSAILQNFERSLNTTDLKEQERLMNFVIVGAGPTGVELAGALAELKRHILPKDYPDLDIRKMQIHLIEAADKVLPSMSAQSANKSAKFLKKMGVNLWLSTQVKGFDGKVVTTNKRTFTVETLIWAAGVKGMPISGINASLTKGNRHVVNETNQVGEEKRIYAIGDVAAIVDEKNPYGHAMLASVAAQQGAWLGRNFNLLARNKPTRPFRYRDKGTMATIGRNLAVVDLPHLKFSGIAAWLTWMFVHLMLLVDFRNRLVVFVNWMWSYVNFDKGTRLITRKVGHHDKTEVKT
jgi:NADH dehydrogenase